MKKFFKSGLLVLMLLAIVIGNSSQAFMKSKMPKPFKIGLPFSAASNDPTRRAIINSVKTVVEAAGGKMVGDNTQYSPDGQVTSIQKLISMGVDGLLIVPSADSILPRVKQMCENAKIPFAIFYRSIKDPDIKKLVESSRYYVGNCWEDEEDTANKLMCQLTDLGAKNVALINVNKGDTTGDARDRGIMRAAQEKGAKILAETRGITQAADITKAVESFIAAFPEMDGLYIAATTAPGALDAAVKALEDHGKAGKIKLVKIDFNVNMADYLAKGELAAAAGGHTVIDPTFSCALLVNRVMGKPLSAKPISINIKMIIVKSASEAQNYLKYVEGDIPPFTKDEIRNAMIKYFNPKVTKETIVQMVNSFNVDDVEKRHKNLFK